MVFPLLQLVALYIISGNILLPLLRHANIWNPKRLPPGPFPLPILGNLLDLGEKPHKSLAEIARRYGPLVSLQLGTVTMIVVLAPSVARELFQKHDAATAHRCIGHALTVFDHHLASVVLLPPGPRLRNLRRICTSHIFASTRLDAGQGLRREKVKQLLSHVKLCSETNRALNIGQAMFATSLNILSNTIFSMDLASLSSSSSTSTSIHDLKELVWSMLVEVGKPNVSDFFPVLKPIDPQGIRLRTSVVVGKLLKIFDEVIESRVRLRRSQTHDSVVDETDVLDTLLRINDDDRQQSDYSGSVDISHLLLDLLVAGTDTTSSSIEWAMTELLANPEKMKKAQAELDQVIGRGNPIEETEVERLPYLQAIIKETLRLHPSLPFLIPRRVNTSIDLHGFSIPKDAQIFINVWAMSRDESVWRDANLFEPERFLSSQLDCKGRDYEFIPFGSGRRMCIGMALAMKILPFALGALIHSFDWKLEGEIESQLDMDDKFGITLQKAKPLCVLPFPRPSE